MYHINTEVTAVSMTPDAVCKYLGMLFEERPSFTHRYTFHEGTDVSKSLISFKIVDNVYEFTIGDNVEILELPLSKEDDPSDEQVALIRGKLILLIESSYGGLVSIYNKYVGEHNSAAALSLAQTIFKLSAIEEENPRECVTTSVSNRETGDHQLFYVASGQATITTVIAGVCTKCEHELPLSYDSQVALMAEVLKLDRI